MSRMTVSGQKLQVVVASHCQSCDVSLRLARELAQTFPRLMVEIVDLDTPNAVMPEAAFAVPTFLLDGRVMWLGNPPPAEALARLSEALHDT